MKILLANMFSPVEWLFEFFPQLSFEFFGSKSQDSKFDFAIFGGGSDVSPSFYGENKHPLTRTNPGRDEQEKEVFEFCAKNYIPMLGICRGAQFLTVMNGGSLIQHVTGHDEDHYIQLKNGKTIFVTSTHHQMMYPWDSNNRFEILGYSVPRLSVCYQSGNLKEKKPEVEPEIVFWHKTQSLCIQGHPEYPDASLEFVCHCVNLMKEFFHV